MDTRELQDKVINRAAVWHNNEVPPLYFRVIEVGGETGEMMEEFKKLERLRMGIATTHASDAGLRREVCDIFIAATALANDLGMDLDSEIKAKFNETSMKYQLPLWKDL